MQHRPIRRVVVTGLGLVTPLGTGVEKTWKALCAGESGIGRITRFDPSGYDAQIAGEVKDFDPAQFIEKKEIKKMDTFIHYAVGASQLAVEDARLTVAPEEATRVGVYIGSGIGGLGSIEHYHDVLKEKGPGRGSPFFYSHDDHQSGFRPGGHSPGSKRAQFLRGHGLRHGESLHRRCHSAHSAG